MDAAMKKPVTCSARRRNCVDDCCKKKHRINKKEEEGITSRSNITSEEECHNEELRNWVLRAMFVTVELLHTLLHNRSNHNIQHYLHPLP